MKEHLLIIRFSALGDVAMAVPVVASLARQYPDLRITVLSRPFARVFFENLAPNVGFMGADVKNEYAGLHGLNKLYRRLLAQNIPAVDRKSTRLKSSHANISYAVFCLKKKNNHHLTTISTQRHHTR